MEWTQDYIEDTAAQFALETGIRRDILFGLIEIESSWNPFQIRTEESFFRRYLQNKERQDLLGWVPSPRQVPTLATELRGRSMSWSVMQIMGDRARMEGFDDPWFTKLIIPEVGLKYGCRFLVRLFEKHDGDIRKVADGWNGGSDLTYADRWLEAAKKYA